MPQMRPTNSFWQRIIIDTVRLGKDNVFHKRSVIPREPSLFMKSMPPAKPADIFLLNAMSINDSMKVA
jgi:hypothetical protein